MKKDLIIKIAKFVLKYVCPIVLGWLEGDSHLLIDTFSGFINSIF